MATGKCASRVQWSLRTVIYTHYLAIQCWEKSTVTLCHLRVKRDSLSPDGTTYSTFVGFKYQLNYLDISPCCLASGYIWLIPPGYTVGFCLCPTYTQIAHPIADNNVTLHGQHTQTNLCYDIYRAPKNETYFITSTSQLVFASLHCQISGGFCCPY